jgi:potassium-transporting ATPase potassium-binding subunit
VYVLLPLSILFTLIFVSQGVLQNLAPYQEVTTLEGVKQIIAMGPVASQEAIKELGTNGGSFNANSAHPFENPSPFTNLVRMLLIFSIPAALTYAYGKMANDTMQGWAILAAMFVLFFGGVTTAYWAESKPNPILASEALDQSAGNLEGKELRFGVTSSALFATVTTDASCGAVNSMHDSFSPLGGLVPMVNIQLGELIFGGSARAYTGS